MKSKTLLVTTLALAMVGLAYAGPSKPNILTPWYGTPDEMVSDLFERHDANKNGTISRDEAKAYFEEMAKKAN
jgi:hypothetical protein